MVHCYPQHILLDHPSLITATSNAPTNTGITYGNNQTQPIKRLAHVGNYTAHVTPSSIRDCIIAHAPIVDEGHIIINTKTETIIRDITEQYELRFPKNPEATEWTLPIDVLNQLTNLRNNYPLSEYDYTRMLQPFNFGRARDITTTLPGIARPNPTIRSARLNRNDKGIRARVLALHERMGHTTEDNMVHAITRQHGYAHPIWVNADVSTTEIRTAFRHEPCLMCVLAKRRKESTHKWLSHVSSQPDSKLIIDTPTKEEDDEVIKQLLIDQETKIGEIIYCDDVPVNPRSIENHNYFFLFRDTKSRKIFTMNTMYNDDDTYLECLGNVLLFFKNIYKSRPELGVQPPTIVRTDRHKTFKSRDSQKYYLDNNCEHQEAGAYRHHQVAAERDIQTVIQNVAASIHTNDFIRANVWSRALEHWSNIWGNTPISETGIAPNQILQPRTFVIDLHRRYRFAFGDLLCYHLEKKVERTFKFDLKNEVGFYMGDDKATKDDVIMYRPFYHDLIRRGGVAKLEVSELQLLRWYGKRVSVRQPTLSFNELRDGMLDLVPYIFIDDKPNIDLPSEEHDDDDIHHAKPPSEQHDDDVMLHTDLDDEPVILHDRSPILSDNSTKRRKPTNPKRSNGGSSRKNYRNYADRIILPVETQALGPRQLRNHDNVDYNALHKGIRTISSSKAHYDTMHHENIDTNEDNVELATLLREKFNEIEKNDNDDIIDLENTVLRICRISTLTDPTLPPGVTSDDSLSIKEALRIDEREGNTKFRDAIKAEIVGNLITKTQTLVPIDRDSLAKLGRYWKIHIVVKCKRKLKADNSYDKHKARGAARGDEYLRQLLRQGIKPPKTFSPTIAPLTFQFVLQIAVAKRLKHATCDIDYAYLNAPVSDDEDTIIIIIDDTLADICSLPHGTLYRVNKSLYGLPSSGRNWYKHYSSNLILEGYAQSKFDPCLFFRINEEETTYVCLFVDDTYIFSSSQTSLDNFVSKMNNHYNVTLDSLADSFLGIHFQHCDDGSTLLTQPKLLDKLFRSTNTGIKSYKYNHPYGSPPGKDHEALYKASEATDYHKYLQLLGLLLYITKSRPDIMAAVSICATKAASPNQVDLQRAYYIVEYLRKTQLRGHRIHHNTDHKLQLYCTVDASYLTHPDSKGQTGYTIGLSHEGTFYNRSAKQQLVSTSSTHAEIRAIYTLVKDIIFLLSLALDLKLNIQTPAIIMEDNSAVVTITTDDTAYMKKCKHFLMLINYIKEQVNLGIIDILKILGSDNPADIHTKPLYDKSFEKHAANILGDKLH